MPNPLGGDTRDMIALGQTHPAETTLALEHREAANQATGRRYRRIGIAILVGAFFAALASAVIAEDQVFHSTAAQIFAALTLFALIAAGSLMTALGLNERREQPLRALTRLALVEGQKNTEQLGLLVRMVEAGNERLAIIEQVIDKVPSFGEGVVFGAELRTNTVTPGGG